MRWPPDVPWPITLGVGTAAVVAVALTGSPALHLDGGAGIGLDRPAGVSRVWATVGLTGLCVPSRHDGQDVEVTGVHAARSSVAPLAMAASVQTAGTSLGAALGRAPEFAESYVSPPFDLSATAVGTGYRIDPVCRDGRSDLTLLVSVEAGPGGADLEGFVVDYTVDGSPRSLAVDGEVTVCGDREAGCRHGHFEDADYARSRRGGLDVRVDVRVDVRAVRAR